MRVRPLSPCSQGYGGPCGTEMGRVQVYIAGLEIGDVCPHSAGIDVRSDSKSLQDLDVGIQKTGSPRRLSGKRKREFASLRQYGSQKQK